MKTHTLLISGIRQLKDCLRCVIQEQHHCLGEVSASTLSSVRLQQRLAVLTRYLTAMSRHCPSDSLVLCKKKQVQEANLSKQKRYWIEVFLQIL